MPHFFSFPQKPRNKLIRKTNLSFSLSLTHTQHTLTHFVLERERKRRRERENWRKKQRIKRDRMLTNFMSLFLEGRLFVWRFLIWDLSLFLSLKEKKKLSLSLKKKLCSFSQRIVCVAGPADRKSSIFSSTWWRSKLLPMVLQRQPLCCFVYLVVLYSFVFVNVEFSCCWVFGIGCWMIESIPMRNSWGRDC